MDVTTQANLWALTGSMYAIAGAALMWAATLASPLSGAVMSTVDTATQRLDARVGGGLLTVGLFIHAIGTATQSATQSGAQSEAMARSAAFLLAGLAFLLLFYVLGKDLLIGDPASTNEAAANPATQVGSKPQLIAQADVPLELEDLRAAGLRQH